MLLFLQLTFSFEYGFSDPKDVMLDDIRFENCAEGDVPAGSDQLSCNFESNICSWYRDYNASLLWERNENGPGPAGRGEYPF